MKRSLRVILIALMALHNGIIHAQGAPDVPQVQKKSFFARAKRALTYKKIKRTLSTPTAIKAFVGTILSVFGLAAVGKRLHNRSEHNELEEGNRKHRGGREPWEKGGGSGDDLEQIIIDVQVLKDTLKNGHQLDVDSRNTSRHGSITDPDFDNTSDLEDDILVVEAALADQDGEEKSGEPEATPPAEIVVRPLEDIFADLDEFGFGMPITGVPTLDIDKHTKTPEELEQILNPKPKKTKKYRVLRGKSAQKALKDVAKLAQQEEQTKPYPVPYNGYMANLAALRHLLQLPLTVLAQNQNELRQRYTQGQRLPYQVYVHRFINLSTEELFEQQTGLMQAYKNAGDRSRLRELLTYRTRYQNLATNRGLPAPR